MRGKKRIQPGYHAARGWYYKSVQKVIKKWDPTFGREFTHENFQKIRRVMENGRGLIEVEIQSVPHRQFLCELMTALNELHDPDSIDGWVVKIWPVLGDNPSQSLLLSYAEIKQRIKDLGGPDFSVDALKKSARRLRMLVSAKQSDWDEFTVHNPALPACPS